MGSAGYAISGIVFVHGCYASAMTAWTILNTRMFSFQVIELAQRYVLDSTPDLREYHEEYANICAVLHKNVERYPASYSLPCVLPFCWTKLGHRRSQSTVPSRCTLLCAIHADAVATTKPPVIRKHVTSQPLLTHPQTLFFGTGFAQDLHTSCAIVYLI